MLWLLACTGEGDVPLPPVTLTTCDTLEAPVGTDDPSAAPIEGLSAEWEEAYDDGYSAFELIYRSGSGIGPAYIHETCAACHAGASRGPQAVTKMVVMDGDLPAADQSALPWGHTERPEVGGGATTPITVPEDVDGLLVTTREAPPVFGRGYLEAIADEEIERVEAEQAEAGRVSGRINRLDWSAVEADSPFHDHVPGDTGLIGRFGLKARIVTLDEFAADALQGDMSITTPLRPDELPNPDELDDDYRDGVDTTVDRVNDTANYTRLLAIPTREEAEVPEVFDALGCAECHVPTLRTRADYPIEPLADIDAPVYTDMLLHDMGEAMADGLEDGDAESSEWRTAPLIGLRFIGPLLHDGRAASPEEAIVAHDGEAAFARDAYAAASNEERAALCGFLAGL